MASDKTEEYNGTSWSNGGDLITGRWSLSGAGTQTAAVCMGGYSEKDETELYDGTSWSAGSDLLGGRNGAAGCGTQSTALCIGGHQPYQLSQYTNTTEEYRADVVFRESNRSPDASYALFSASQGLGGE